MIFESAVPDDEAKFEIINSILTNLDPGFREDYQLLNEVFRRKEFIGSLASATMKRAIFDRIQTLLPGNPFVLQHRSILEKDLADIDEAIRYAKSAQKLEPSNAAIINTLGLAYEYKARISKDRFERDRLLQDALRLFEEGIRKEPRSPFGYLGKHFVLRHSVTAALTNEENGIARAGVLSFLEMAHEQTNESPVIGKELALARRDLGDVPQAIAILKAGIERTPNETRLRDLYITLLLQKGDVASAREVAFDGAKIDPSSWRLQRHIARLRRMGNEPVGGVKGAYEAAIRANKGDVSLYIELASYLFMSGDWTGAATVFEQANALPLTGQDRSRIRDHWREGSNKIVFDGIIRRIRGGGGTVMAVPRNFEAFFWRSSNRLMALREGDKVKFTVGFNTKGAVAFIQ
ncbi:hypothetical protein FRUB_04312 [Fimbriiglobus ruber]|uniref:Tetratricopeptide repeat protein n=1 Tax=Fimbriiglobus ruber TaxID=1908690 RepID=A0A225DRH1_9BACT|nr:hypothetical protein FRUB_04312 [Fimbriiglobus ruber]